MKLPYSDQIEVPRAKIVSYLLSLTHEDGRSKAQFFLRFGFSAEKWKIMATSLVTHAKTHNITRIEKSPFGLRYIIEGSIVTPDGRHPLIRAIWFIGHNTDIPQFVTAYPLRRLK